MTESGHEERVQEPGVVGLSHDTDDRLEDLEIYEALINPHDGSSGSQKRGGGGGAPAMMPMGNTGGSGKAETAAAGTTAAGSARGTSAASAGAGKASGFSGTGGAGASGVGGAGYGSAGPGAGALPGVGGTGSAGLGGLSSGLGSGGPGSGSSWTMPSYGTGAAGMPDPTTDQSGTGAGATSPGGLTVPGFGAPPTTTVSTPTVPGTGSGGIPPIKVPSASTPGGSGIAVPSAPGGGGGGGGGAPASTASLGVKTVQASPEMLHKEAQYWDDTTRDFSANVVHPVGNQSPSSVDFGMMTGAFSPYNDLLNRLKKWSTDAASEFSAISDTLQAASGGYKDTEDTNTAASTQAQNHSRIAV